jgi:SET domain-containing protein
MEEFLKVKKSKIPGAGKGLFTKKRIKKGEVIVEYKGEKLTWAQCLRRYKNGNKPMHYVFCVSPKNSIDAGPCPNELARYANDANPDLKINGLKNNSEYQIIRRKPYIVATKSIPPDSEILVDYGDDYWEKD